MENNARIIVVGDWHRHYGAYHARRVISFAEREGIDKILQLGDFGYRFGSDDHSVFEKPLHRALAKADVNLYFIDGNHENHPCLQALASGADGFKSVSPQGRIFYAPRGHRWQWGGRTFGALGGAYSINHLQLEEGRTLFAELEEPREEDLARLGSKPLDYLVAHEVPAAVDMQVNNDFGMHTRRLLQRAVDSCAPRRVFSGHWHRRVNYDIPRADGGVSEGHILHREQFAGTFLILDLAEDRIEAPPTDWNR